MVLRFGDGFYVSGCASDGGVGPGGKSGVPSTAEFSCTRCTLAPWQRRSSIVAAALAKLDCLKQSSLRTCIEYLARTSGGGSSGAVAGGGGAYTIPRITVGNPQLDFAAKFLFQLGEGDLDHGGAAVRAAVRQVALEQVAD
jgi:hypothetical protein